MKSLTALLPCFLLLSICGCSGGSTAPDVTLVPVTGTVTLDGAPLVNASVLFSPWGDLPGQPAYGITDNSGKYELKYINEKTGCPAGQFRVTISKFAQADGSPFPKDMPAEETSSAGVEHVPAIYSNSEQTKLFIEVSPSGSVHDFDLIKKK